MNKGLVGWSFVVVQAGLILTLMLLPGRADWPTEPWLRWLGAAIIGSGFGLMAVAALALGVATLTATPTPRESGELQTGGLYRHVRHPIYTGVLAAVLGLTMRSGSFVIAAVAIVTVGFFNAKAQWEEAQLAKTYPDYRAYARSTPRFVPRPWNTNSSAKN